MSIVVNVNGESINYPQTGDTNWGDEATDFAVQASSALAKIGLSTGTTVDLPGTLDVTGNTTLDANLSVGGNASVTGTTSLTGNVTLTNNLTVNGNTQLGNANTDTIGVTGIVNVDAGTFYVDPVNNRVGINKTSPLQTLDVVGTLGVTGDVAINTNKFNVTASSGNTSIAGTLGVTGNTTLTGQTLASDGTALLPGISFSSDSNTGIFRSGSDQLDIVTGGSSRFRIESTGQIKAVYESTLGTDYNTQLDNAYLCRAWVNFDGTSSNLTGTYSRAGTTITVSITSHGLTTGQSVYLDFTTGTGTDGIYIVTVVNANSYTVTDTVSGSTSGNVTQFRYIRASGNVSSITDGGVGTYTINFTTALPDVNYTFVCVSYVDQTTIRDTRATTAPIILTSSLRLVTSYAGVAEDQSIINLAVFR